jgi:hypothetical protein
MESRISTGPRELTTSGDPIGCLLSEEVAVATGSLKEKILIVHAIDENPVRLDMAVS